MGDEVKRPQGQPHRHPRVPKKLQQEYRHGAAGTPQECHGWVKRLQEQPRARKKWAQAAIMLQKPRAAVEPQEMRAVVQLLEAKVGGVANPLPQPLKCCSHGWPAQPSCLGMCLPSVHPQTFQLAVC